jgi:cyclase
MKRRNFIQNSALTLGTFALSGQKLWANIFAEEAYKMKTLRGGVGVFSEKGGTIAYLINKKGIAVVDAQFPEQANHLIEELKKQSQQPIKFLINTHHHGDHTSGNIAFKGLAKNVVTHENSLINHKARTQKDKTEDKQLYADTTFADTWTGKVGKESIKMHYFGAGHTNGDSIVHFEHANIAHMGDLMFNGRHPAVDKVAGANLTNWIKVLDKAQNTFDNQTIFVFGHAQDPEKITGTKDDLKAFADYLGKVQLIVEAEIKSGKTKEEILKITTIQNTEWSGGGIQMVLSAAFDELSNK